MNTRKTLVAALVVMWLYSGLQPILTVPTESLHMLARVGISAAWQWPLLLAASVCDVAVALWIVWRPSRTLWWLQCGLVAFYSVVIALWLPENWLHPFGPLIKNLPIMAMMAHLATTEARRV